MYPFLKDAPFRPCFCFVHTIAQFSRILRFSHIYCQIFRIVPFVHGSRYKINEPLRPLNSECITSTIGSEKFQKFHWILFWCNILKSWPREKELPVHRYSYMVKYLIKFVHVVIINRRWEKLIFSGFRDISK
jgi:hypothetical protein